MATVRRHVSRCVAVAVLPFVCTSCFTMGLWGFPVAEEADPCTGRTETSFRYDDDTEWSWDMIGLRLLLTPLTVGLDVVTGPVQCFLLDDGEDDCGR